MISRTGMMWFLYQCFGINNTKAKRTLIACAIIQIVVNSFTILQIVLQCGPNPYHLVSATDQTSATAILLLLLSRSIAQSIFIICGIPFLPTARSLART